MKKKALQLIERENLHQLEEDTTLSALSVGWITLTIGGGIVFLIALRGQQPFSSALSYEPLFAVLLMLGVICLVLLTVCYGRYRSERTFWEYLLSRKHIPLSHWTIPIKLDGTGRFAIAVRSRQLCRFGKRYRPHHRPKHKAPILLFQQAPLLLAP